MPHSLPVTARLARKAYFSSAHRYFNPALSEKENQEIFGSCFSPYGHGHNYVLEAYFEGPIDPATGMVMNLHDIDQILKAVVGPLDHHHLNFDIPYFKSIIPTTENIAKYLFENIQSHLQSSSFSKVELYKVRLHENEDLWVDYGFLEAAP